MLIADDEWSKTLAVVFINRVYFTLLWFLCLQLACQEFESETIKLKGSTTTLFKYSYNNFVFAALPNQSITRYRL